MTPKEANTRRKIEKLKRNCWFWGDYWFLVGIKSITIAKQKAGHSSEWIVMIPRGIFEAMIRVYETGSKKFN